jgi:hypothetical protein
VPQFIAEAEAQVRQLEAQVALAQAQLDQARLNLSWTRVTAPQDGWITKRNVEQGNYVQAGQSIFSIVTPEVWITANFKESQLDRMRPAKFAMTYFGGEPLLNLPVVYDLADRLWAATQARGIPQSLSMITNGLLLTTDVVDRLVPRGLRGIKITLDGTAPRTTGCGLRGGQGTFDRIIDNIRKVAPRISIGKPDESLADSFPRAADSRRSRSSRTSWSGQFPADLPRPAASRPDL